jgi:hypothetical protein
MDESDIKFLGLMFTVTFVGLVSINTINYLGLAAQQAEILQNQEQIIQLLEQ